MIPSRIEISAHAKNITGIRSGRLVAMYPVEKRGNAIYWLCRCDCGSESTTICVSSVIANVTKSCGCLSKDLNRDRAANAITKLPEYKTWDAMRYRCKRKSAPQYPNYGGRGISVCNSWDESFMAFYNDMGSCPPGLSIDRIDNDGNYEPSNCRWATPTEQMRNRRGNRIIRYKNSDITLAEAAERSGISTTTILNRITRGWPAKLWYKTAVELGTRHAH